MNSKVIVQPAFKRLKNFQEVSSGLPKKIMTDEAIRYPQCQESPCLHGCPIGVDIPGFIRFLREGDVTNALARIREQNDLPGICGRVCPAPCESACVLEKEKNSIGVRALERFAADNGRPRFGAKKRITPTGKKIAIVGSGPAGLVAAAQLAKRGHKVTVFELLPLLGGVLRYGIPEFRLPKNVLDAEIEEVRALGVEFKNNFVVGQGTRVEQFMREGFSAVLLATGKGGPAFSKLAGAELAGVHYAKEVLLSSNLRFENQYRKYPRPEIASQVAVLGKGNAALDCARVCLRLGKEVSLIFASAPEDITIYPDDLALAKEEGLKVEAPVQALEILSDSQETASGVKCLKMDFADAGNGRWKLAAVPGSEFIVPAQTVILADPSKVNSKIFGTSFRLNENGAIWADAETGMTSLRGVFAAGDCLSDNSIVTAMASGKKAALQILQFLQ